MNEIEKKYVKSIIEVSGIEMLLLCQFWQDEMIRAAMEYKEMGYDTQH